MNTAGLLLYGAGPRLGQRSWPSLGEQPRSSIWCRSPGAAVTESVNQFIAEQLREIGDLLERSQANPFRVRAYRQAADTVVSFAEDLRELFEREGTKGLVALPGVRAGIAAAIAEMLRTGRWSRLERQRGRLDPRQIFRAIPGVGAKLARRIHDTLHVDTIEAARPGGRPLAGPPPGESLARAAARWFSRVLARTPRAREQHGGEGASRPAHGPAERLLSSHAQPQSRSQWGEGSSSRAGRSDCSDGRSVPS